jgi:modulator of FtsH protease
VDAAYNPELWHELAVMVGGAAAALAGLLVVAMSINIEEIVAEESLPRRAGAALIMTVSPMVVSLFVLVPDQSATALGAELLVVGIILGVCLPVLNRPRTRTAHQSIRQWVGSTLTPMVALVLAVVLAGVGMLTTSMGALYWLPLAVVAALFGGLIQAWVLLVEIRR